MNEPNIRVRPDGSVVVGFPGTPAGGNPHGAVWFAGTPEAEYWTSRAEENSS